MWNFRFTSHHRPRVPTIEIPEILPSEVDPRRVNFFYRFGIGPSPGITVGLKVVVQVVRPRLPYDQSTFSLLVRLVEYSYPVHRVS